MAYSDGRTTLIACRLWRSAWKSSSGRVPAISRRRESVALAAAPGGPCGWGAAPAPAVARTGEWDRVPVVIEGVSFWSRASGAAASQRYYRRRVRLAKPGPARLRKALAVAVAASSHPRRAGARAGARDVLGTGPGALPRRQGVGERAGGDRSGMATRGRTTSLGTARTGRSR